MLSGTVYTLVGIKNKWLHIFLSAAYLASIAVTVLILYVMNPPVSDPIQGKFIEVLGFLLSLPELVQLRESPQVHKCIVTTGWVKGLTL